MDPRGPSAVRGGGASSARRWRERRLRTAWRRKHPSIAIALAAAVHRSAWQNQAPWRQTAARARVREDHAVPQAVNELVVVFVADPGGNRGGNTTCVSGALP